MVHSQALALLGLLSFVTAVPAAVEERSALKCTDFKLPVTATAKNVKITKVPKNLKDPTVFIDFLISSASLLAGDGDGGLGRVLTNGTFSMSGRYCEPEVFDAAKADTIIYMQHAITMDKNYWNGLSYPHGFEGTTYSFLNVASKAGYPTIAFDNLGSGQSEHPDPIAVTQQTLQVEVIHNIIQKLRKGEVKGPVKGKKFSKVVYVGHSYGSICGNAIATHHPEDVDAFILTGYSGQFAKGAGPLAAGLVIPASLVHKRFHGLDPGYLAMSSVKGRKYGLYTNPAKLGGFNPKAPEYDFEHEGTVSIGELATLLYGVGPADVYKGHVLAITGENDAIACNHPIDTVPHCGRGKDSIPMQAGAFFPNAKDYTVHIPAKTGHDANIHFSSPKSFVIAMEWLKKHGF